MKKLLLLMMLSAPCYAQEVKVNPDGSVMLTLSKQEADNCKNNGGCLVIPLNELEAIMREAAKNMCGRKWTI